MKKILCLFLMLFTFGLAGCGSSKQLKDAEIDEDSYGEIFSLVTRAAAIHYYYDEATFKPDPNDSNYEIGYVYEISSYYTEVGDEDVAIGSIDHFRARRDKERRDYEYLDDENDPTGNTYQIKYIPVDLDKDTPKGFYKLTYTQYDEWGNFDIFTAKVEKITKKEAAKYIGFEIWEIPNKEVKIDFKKDESGKTTGYEINVKLKGEKEYANYLRGAYYDSDKEVSYAARIKNCFSDTDREFIILVLDSALMQKVKEEMQK